MISFTYYSARRYCANVIPVRENADATPAEQCLLSTALNVICADSEIGLICRENPQRSVTRLHPDTPAG